jgi:hypothetical protein
MGRGFDGLPRHAEIGDVWIDVSVRESHEVTADVTRHPVEEGTDISDHIRPEPRTISIEGLVTNHPLELPLSHAGTARLDPSGISLNVASANPPRVEPHDRIIQGEPSVGFLSAVPGVDQAVALLGAISIEVRSKVELSMELNHTNPLAANQVSANALHFTEPFDRVGAVHAALQRIMDESLLVTVVTGLAIYQQVALSSLTMERSAQIGSDALRFNATGIVIKVVSSQFAKVPDPLKQRGKPAVSQGKQQTTPDPDAAAKLHASLVVKTKDWFINWLDTRP